MSIAHELRARIPAIYLQRDAQAPQAGMLEALLDVLGEQADVVADDLAQRYGDWFIETCADWVVPYIGDLLGVRPINPVSGGRPLPRAYVANTLAYRRRKGTPAVLEELARDVTGWPAKAVELFTLLATTQHVDHLRPANVRTLSLRDMNGAELTGGPFERSPHTADGRGMPAGRYGITNVGLFLWRLQTFGVARVAARPVTDPPDGRYHLDPMGGQIALYNPPLPEASITSLATERHLPVPLRRRALFDELEALRAGLDAGPLSYFGVDPVVEVFADVGAGLGPIAPEQLTAADLSDPPPDVTTGWRRPEPSLTAAIDPVLGRLAFRAGLVPDAVAVSYVYAAAAAIGAGPYDRGSKRSDTIIRSATFVRAVGSDLPEMPGLTESELPAAALAWNAQPAGTVGVIVVVDDGSYPGDVNLTVPAGSTLLVTAGAWPGIEDELPATPRITRVQLDARRPHVHASITVVGGPGAAPGTPRGEVMIDGLLIEGDVIVADGDLGRLDLAHVTVGPGIGRVHVPATNRDLTLTIDRSIVGPLDIPGEGPLVTVTTSVVDGSAQAAVDVPACVLTLNTVTVFGQTVCRALTANDCLLVGVTTVERTQEGCVRYSYVSDGSRTPRRHHCQPDLGLQAGASEDAAAIEARLTPQLSSSRFGDADYAVLDDRSAEELRRGSSHGSDMGVFAALQRPDRDTNLRIALDEYLRVGLQAAAFHES
jgi:hypothetical protein